MTRRFSSIFLLSILSLLLPALPAGIAWAQTVPSYVYSGPLLPSLLQLPQNGWLRVNANLYSDVWTPPELEPLDWGATHTPSKIILAWSGFAWDTKRGDIILYGGGHANYSGNDVYRWRSSTLRWERAALPSEILFNPATAYSQAIDGVDNAPSSAHTYDNNIFLPVADRFLTWGGASYNDGQPYLRPSEANPAVMRFTGPYVFDPSKADGNKVGGTTGSHVKRVAPHPEIVGGQMWKNRDIPKNLAGQPMPGSYGSGCTGYATENGKDVVYVSAANFVGAPRDLYRYQLTDIADPTKDQMAKVGRYMIGLSGTITCGFDPVRKLFVQTGTNSIPFVFWDLTTPGSTNNEHAVTIDSTIAGFQAWLTAQSFDIANCALKFDPTRQKYPIWCGGPTIWELQAPAGGNTETGWTIVKRPAPTTSAPTTDVHSIGILGKWRYVPYYDVFIALEDVNEGHVWVYKPTGWVQPNPPGNALPTVTVTSPANGATVAPGSPLSLTATASDPDGAISRVEFYANGIKLGEDASAPYAVPWTPILVGTYAIVAVAVDNVGGMTASATVNLTVSAPLTTAILQRGLGGYSGVSDTLLNATAPTISFGASDPLYVDGVNYALLLRFGVFQSAGGPVPNGAVVQSAKLELYKQYYDSELQLNSLLKPWVESQATWLVSQTGVPWSAPGAAGSGTDYDAIPDAVAAGTFTPGWLAFDVTLRMRQWSSGVPNNGWRIDLAGAGGVNAIQLNSSEYGIDPTQRPKLTVVYAPAPSGNIAPTVTLTNPLNGASTTLGGSFALTATAGDVDGTVSKVEFLVNGAAVGQATSAPYGMNWTPPAPGSYTLTARATDNGGAATTSNAATVTVTATSSSTTVVLQRGLTGYAGASDTFLDKVLQRTVRGALSTFYLDGANYTPLVRFAVFQAEGGPVPNGAAIQSAKLELYKQFYDGTVQLNALLKSWDEAEATWSDRQANTPWSAGGAAGVGTDYSTSTDALVTAGFDPGWVAFDVTPRVQTWSMGTATNFGWRVTQTSTSTINAKIFNSSEYSVNATQRPKLTVVYDAPSGNVAPTVALTSPLNGASTTLGGNFALAATAGDVDGTIAKVEFLANGAVVGQDTSAPYSLTWIPPAVGSYTLTARATDNAGAATTSTAVTVTVAAAGNVAPTVALTSPSNGIVAILGLGLGLTATAADVDGTIAKVEFLANGAVVGQDTSAPYSLTWIPSAVGIHVLTARATDNAGAVTTSNAVTVTVAARARP